MLKQIVSEKEYSVSFYLPGTKANYGFSVGVSGESKAKVMREAAELLEKAQMKAIEQHKVYSQAIGGKDDADSDS